MEGHVGSRLTGVRPARDRQVALSVSSDRPRDRLGRPLDPGDPRAYPGVPERSEIDGATAWNEANEYLRRDLPFHAHEVFEQRWKCAPGGEREVWRALAQWGAALTQQARGNDVGQRRLAARARANLEGALTREEVPEYIDAPGVMASLSQLA